MVDQPDTSHPWILWIAAIVSFALLLLNGPLYRLASGRGRDAASRLLKGGFFIAVPFVALFPALAVATPGPEVNIALLFYIVFFSLFCYYTGKRSGWTSGRRDLSDFVGFDSPDDLEDAQDRLFESRLRFPRRSQVADSIAQLARSAKAGQPEAEKPPPPPSRGGASPAPVRPSDHANTDSRQ